MITLTEPIPVKTQLGGSSTVNYDEVVLGPFTMNAVAQTVIGTVRVTSSAVPSMQAINGTLRISIADQELVIEVQQLDFYRRLVLNSGQRQAVLDQIESAQAQLENGLVSLGLIVGTRTAGV